ncbi:MAG: lipoyl(octanoyl) transferase LipB [Firmicutes bacterium]|nr:lipoyl(octanoyl) transferase LipB [Bacillota bacterium]
MTETGDGAGRPIGWTVRLGQWDYSAAWDLQARLVRARIGGQVPDLLLLVEHPHVYTVGRGGDGRHILWDEERLRKKGVDVYYVDRGGDVTYHGPGQAVGYPIVSLRGRGLDPHRYLRDLEEVLIRALAGFGIRGRRVEGLTGVWVDGAKVAAIGVRFTRAVTSHGFALNVNTDLSYFDGIIPCGITGRPVTSMQALLGRPVDMDAVCDALIASFSEVFGLKMRWVGVSAIDQWAAGLCDSRNGRDHPHDLAAQESCQSL